jgi:hypothetical protein
VNDVGTKRIVQKRKANNGAVKVPAWHNEQAAAAAAAEGMCAQGQQRALPLPVPWLLSLAPARGGRGVRGVRGLDCTGL